jgi:hypothetical protein
MSGQPRLRPSNVRDWGQAGRDMLRLSSSHFDPMAATRHGVMMCCALPAAFRRSTGFNRDINYPRMGYA